MYKEEIVFISTCESEVPMGYLILLEILHYRLKMEKRWLLFRGTSTSHLILNSDLAFAQRIESLFLETHSEHQLQK